MDVFLDDVTFWADEWNRTNEPISDAVAHKIADYWQSNTETGALVRFARWLPVPLDELLDDVESAIRYVRSAGGLFHRPDPRVGGVTRMGAVVRLAAIFLAGVSVGIVAVWVYSLLRI